MNQKYFEKISAQKATTQDIDNLKVQLVNLSNQIKQVSILQTEIAKSIIPIKQTNTFHCKEDQNSTLQKRDFLAKQAELTSNWIIDESMGNVEPKLLMKLRQNRLKVSHSRRIIRESLGRNFSDDHSDKKLNFSISQND